jgi:cell wall assembly regulator SMI1
MRITVKCRANSGSAGSHCDGARKNGSSIKGGPLPSTRYVRPAWLPLDGNLAAGGCVAPSKNSTMAPAISAARSATTSDQATAS